MTSLVAVVSTTHAQGKSGITFSAELLFITTCVVVLRSITLIFKATSVLALLHLQLFSVFFSIMDGEYIQYLKQEAAASANLIISRVVVMSIYGMVGVYLLSTIMSGVVPMVAAILPLGSLNGLEDHETNEL